MLMIIGCRKYDLVGLQDVTDIRLDNSSLHMRKRSRQSQSQLLRRMLNGRRLRLESRLKMVMSLRRKTLQQARLQRERWS